MGIERVWQQMKSIYRGRIGTARVNKEIYSNFEIVEEIVDDYASEDATICALKGWQNLDNA